MKIRQRIRVTGRVQAVGFRYRARIAAGNYGVHGWVRNEWDGSVVMEVQGTPDQINGMLAQIYASPYIVIDTMERKELALEAEGGFHVRNY